MADVAVILATSQNFSDVKEFRTSTYTLCISNDDSSGK